MIPTCKKLKRGTEFTFNGQTVFIYRQIDEKSACICDNKLMRYDDTYTVILISELKEVLKSRPAIKQFSETRAEENKEYLKVRKPFLEEHPYCEINIPGCTKKATQVHHAAGRIGKLLVDVRYFVPSCGNCHRWAEINPEAAKDMGCSVSRLAI